MSSALISLHDATVAFDDASPPVLDRVSLAVARGAWIAVVGANGAGKTTLLAAIGGVLPLRSGRVERPGTVRSALLLQEPDNQFVATSVRHELALSIPAGVEAARGQARLDEAVDRFALAALLDRNPHRLSGGEKQRLALATVWLEDPDVLLLDEPLAYLDAETREHVTAFVRELNARGVAVLWATPGGEDVVLAREAVLLERGRVVFAGAAADCPPDTGEVDEEASGGGSAAGPARAGQPDDAMRAGGGQRAPARASHQVRRRDWRARSGLLADRTRTSEPASPSDGEEPRERARLRFEAVSFAYGDAPLLRDLNFEVRGGECVGVAGRNSAGKSTLLLLAGGALKAKSGRVVRDTRENGVLYLPQSPERLFFAETVIEEISFGLERRGAPREAARERAIAALRDVSLEPGVFGARSPFQLSLGEMRRVAFAIAASLGPDLLLLDEPASCLDRAGRAALDALIGARTRAGAAVVVASHDPIHLARVCDRVVTIQDGWAS